jgi:hypothetical protein
MKTACSIAASAVMILVVGTHMKLIAQDDADKAPPNAEQQAKEPIVAAKSAMLEAAKKTLEAINAGYDAGTAPMLDVYLWSRRVAEAERSLAQNKREEIAALMDHWRRMGTLNRKVGALYHAGSKGGEVEKFFATKYYLAGVQSPWCAGLSGVSLAFRG